MDRDIQNNICCQFERDSYEVKALHFFEPAFVARHIISSEQECPKVQNGNPPQSVHPPGWGDIKIYVFWLSFACMHRISFPHFTTMFAPMVSHWPALAHCNTIIACDGYEELDEATLQKRQARRNRVLGRVTPELARRYDEYCDRLDHGTAPLTKV